MNRKRNRPAGVALLMVVLVLAMLTIVGVLFSLTVSVHLKTNIQYRERSEVRSAGLAALHRFMAELMYNVWGTDEIRAFTCDDGTPLGVPVGTAVGDYSFGTYAGDPTDPLNPPVAYYKSKTDPSGEADLENLTRPWARFVPSVVQLDHGTQLSVWDGWPYGKIIQNNPYAAQCNGNEDDYRWMVTADLWGGDNAAVVAQRMVDARPNADGTPRAANAGGLYHDEFLPTGLVNADNFELALHYNNATIFGRTTIYGTDEPSTPAVNISLGDYRIGEGSNTSKFHPFAGAAAYWSRQWDAAGHLAGYNVKNCMRDPIDIRQVGTSFYRIFRFDLVDPLDFKVRGTGVDPDYPARYYSEDEIYSIAGYAGEGGVGSGDRIIRATHLGDASSSGGTHNYKRLTIYDQRNPAYDHSYTDPLGNAININQVNLNYSLELYEGLKAHDKKENDKFYHYNESKWIYLYDEDDPEMPAWSRFALYVWPDSGLPNANFLPSRYQSFGNDAFWGMQGLVFNYRTTVFDLVKSLDHGVGESGARAQGDRDSRGDLDGTFNVTRDDGVAYHIMGQLAFGSVRDLGSFFGAGGTIDQSFSGAWTTGDKLYITLLRNLDYHRMKLGAFGSRAEMEVALRKGIFRDTDADLTARKTTSLAGQTWLGGRALAGMEPEDLRLHDAELLADYFSVNSYEYLLDPHWEQDRLIFDGHSLEDWYLRACRNYNNETQRTTKGGGAPYTPGGFCGTDGDGGARNTRQRLLDILSSLKDLYGPYSVPTGTQDAQPGAPLSAFLDNYSQTKNLFGSYTRTGPYHVKRAKAMFLSTLLNATYPIAQYFETYRQYLAVDVDDPAAPPKFNLTPEELLFDFADSDGRIRYRIDQALGPRISEVGSGIFTVPIGPKLQDYDYEKGDQYNERLYVSHVDMDRDPADPKNWITPTKHAMVPADPDYDHRYAFETKWLNFIELTAVGGNYTLSGDWFLRVYGNVRNWEGKCVDDAGNEVTPQPASAANGYRGGKGYVDLFAKVARKKVSDGVDANGDGDYLDLDAGDTPPVYRVKKSSEMTQDEKDAGCDPEHYIEGVVVRYRGVPNYGDRDRANDAGWFTGDSNHNWRYSYDRDWRAEYDPARAGELTTADGKFMRPNFTVDSDTGVVTDFDPAEIEKDGGNYYDIRGGGRHLINVKGTVADNIPDEDWGWPNPSAWPHQWGGSGPQGDGVIDGVTGYFENPDDIFWGKKSDNDPDFYEDLADWLNTGKKSRDENVDKTIIDDLYSARDWSWVTLKAYVSDDDYHYARTVYRFGSWAPHYQYPSTDGNTVFATSKIDYLKGEVKIGDPDAGLEHYGGPGKMPAQYLLVIFPHARTPWTRRGNAVEAAGLSDQEKRDKFGIGHFDDPAAYPDVTDATPRTSNYADGDTIVLGLRSQDGYLRYKQGAAEAQYKKRPRVLDYVKLNGKHPDFAAAGGAAGPACAFERTGATISGGTFIVDDAGGTVTAPCVETLPGGRTESFPSELGRGFSVRDLRDGGDPWTWDATSWDWNAGTPLPAASGTPCTMVPQTPALTTYDSRVTPFKPEHRWKNNLCVYMWEQATDSLGKGRFNKAVHGRNANSIFTQMDQGDPNADDPTGVTTFTAQGTSWTVPNLRLLPDYTDCDYDGTPDVTVAGAGGVGNAAGRGRYPYPISSATNARPSKSVAAEVLNSRLCGFGQSSRFVNSLWLKQVSLGTGDLRQRGWDDLCRTSRAAEYFDSDAMNPWVGLQAPAFSAVRDGLSNDLTGAPEGFTDTQLWQTGNPLKDARGRYWADRKTVRRINLNEIMTPMGLNSLRAEWAPNNWEGRLNDTSQGHAVPMTLLGNKPLRGYTYINGWRSRVTWNNGPRNAVFWSKNMWADSTRDMRGTSVEGVGGRDEKGWSATATVAPSPVYTAFILVQRLDFDGQPLAEEKMRVTVERTWDGKMNVLDFRLTP